jgi:hypothetical protein
MSEERITVRPCEGPAAWRKFERYAEVVNGHYAAFVPPLPGTVVAHLAGRSAFARRHGKVIPLMAWRGGRASGRIAAIINRSHNTCHADKTGFFGFFECEDDPAVAHALVSHAARVLREHGLETIRGPYNPSINDECGLMVGGFSEQSFMGFVWNPPHYEKLLRAAGLVPLVMSCGYLLPLHRLEPPLRLERLAQRARSQSKIRLRPINMDDLPGDLGIIREIYNATLEGNLGFVPISNDDLASAADEIKMIAQPAMIQIAECEGKKAGVALSLPNINEFLAIVKQTPRFLRSAHMLLLLKTSQPRSGRQVAYGITPAFRDRGLHPWLSYEHFLAAKKHFHHAALGWIQETNTETLMMAELLGGERAWRWAIFEKPVAEAAVPPA